VTVGSEDAGRRRHRLTALLPLLVLAACGTSSPPAVPHTSGTAGAVPAAALATPPPAPDPPSPAIAAPVEARELPRGRLAFVTDSGLGSVYEFDLGRRRFLGPAPVTRRYEYGRLPAYPTTLPEGIAPQDATIAGSTLYVGGGDSGTVVGIPISPQGLGTPAVIDLPPAVTRYRDQSRSARTDIFKVEPLPDGRLLAVGRDESFGVEVADVVDPATGVSLPPTQLPGGVTIGPAVPVSGGVALAMSDGTLLVADGDLHLRQVAAIGGSPGGIAGSGGTVYVSLRSPSRLVAVDLAGGAVRPLDSAAHSSTAGPVAVDPAGDVYWHPGDLHLLRRVHAADGHLVATLRACVDMNTLAWSPFGLLATCLGDARLALIPTDGSGYATAPAGYFPQGIAVTP
jgi:hypothetical protein